MANDLENGFKGGTFQDESSTALPELSKKDLTDEEFKQVVEVFQMLRKWRDEAIQNGTWKKPT